MFNSEELTIHHEFIAVNALIDGFLTQLLVEDEDHKDNVMGVSYMWNHFRTRLCEIIPQD